MAPDAVPSIEPDRIGRLKPAHARDQVWLRRFHQQMVMIRHQDERVHTPTRALARLPERGQKLFPIRVIAEDCLLPITAIQQMVNRSGELNSRFARHW
jgi:hypothetical protein